MQLPAHRSRLLATSLAILGTALLLCFIGFYSPQVHAQHPASAPKNTTFALIAHVVGHPKSPVVSEDWLRTQVARANEIFASVQIQFVLTETAPLADAHRELVSRSDRHALTQFNRDQVINWYVPETLFDVDEPGRKRMGVHWRPPMFRPKHFVVTSSYAAPFVLAHELGHFFGNAQHSDVPGNIMSYERTDALPFFDEAQKRIIARHRRRFIKSGELVPWP